MKNELTTSNIPNSMTQVFAMAAKAKESFSLMETLKKIGSKTAVSLYEEQELNWKFQVGYVLGALKANLDCLPDEIAARQQWNGIPLDLLIKMKVDENVLDIREKSHPNEMTLESGYEAKYRRLSECICGFGYNMSFIEARFKEFFPQGTHMFVEGFSVGYSEIFHEVCAQSCIPTEYTDPKAQDIWKNWMYFLKRDVHEYRLDGMYLYMYHGGFNCSGDPSIPYGNNCREVNADVYASLKARKEEEFINQTFDFNF